MSEKPGVLIISGIDPTNGAGLGRDLLTVQENGGFPVSAPSVLTVQNSMSFEYYQPVDIKYIQDCIESLEKEFTFSAIKTGLIPLNEIWISKLAQMFRHFSVPIIIDPVLKATVDKTKDILIPDSYIDMISGGNKIITPNLKELELIYFKLAGKKDSSGKMAEYISENLSCSVITTFEAAAPVISITKAGSTINIPITLYEPGLRFHGTGCTFSSALATNLAKGENITDSVKNAANYILEKVRNAALFNQSGQYYL